VLDRVEGHCRFRPEAAVTGRRIRLGPEDPIEVLRQAGVTDVVKRDALDPVDIPSEPAEDPRTCRLRGGACVGTRRSAVHSMHAIAGSSEAKPHRAATTGSRSRATLIAMRYARAEGAMRASVWHQLPSYRLADMATETLLSVLDQAGFESHESEAEPPPLYWRARALLYLGVLAVRATRAGMVVIASGYEAEAMNHKRTLMEVHSRVQRVVNDRSGVYAREWLRGRAGKPQKAVGGYAPDDLWKMLSHSSHADHRAVENFLAISQPDGSTKLLSIPERRVDVSDAMLAMFASETRDIAVLIAQEHGVEMPDLAPLDVMLKAHPTLQEPADRKENNREQGST
jgi:hypothetical protein